MAKFILSAFADEAGKDLDSQIAALQRNGIPCIEPRNIDKAILELNGAEMIRAAKKLADAGIGLSALGSPIGKFKIELPFEDELTRFRRALNACHIFGTERMRVFSFKMSQKELAANREGVLHRMNILTEEARKEGITLCHENEKNIYGQMPEQVEDLLKNVSGLRGVFDAANYVQCDVNPMTGFETTLPYLEYIHVKDCASEGKFMVPVGQGDGQYEEILRRVDAATENTVYLTLEPHLHDFQAYKKIDGEKLHLGKTYENADVAFDTAASALKELLKKIGFREENHTWIK